MKRQQTATTFIAALLLSIISTCLHAQPGDPTKFYCTSNGQLYTLPLTATDDCNVASCMLRHFCSASNLKIDGGIIYCSTYPVYPNGPYNELVDPICPATLAKTGPTVELFKDENYSNGDANCNGFVFHMGEGLSGMSMVPRANHSAWGWIGENILGLNNGDCVRNDEVTSIRIDPGLKITVWENANYSGRSTVFTKSIANVGPVWNDIISSFRVDAFEGTVKRHDDLHRTIPLAETLLPNSKYIPPYLTFEPQGIYRIRNQRRATMYLVLDQQDALSAAEGKSDLPGAVWGILKMSEDHRFLIANNAVQALLQSSPIDSTHLDAPTKTFAANYTYYLPTTHWRLEPVPHQKQVFRLHNAGNNTYLAIDGNNLVGKPKSDNSGNDEWVFETGINFGN